MFEASTVFILFVFFTKMDENSGKMDEMQLFHDVCTELIELRLVDQF